MADERPPLPDFYAVLGVGFDATNDELRQAWRTAVKQWHPDTNRSPEAHGMMTRINEAWEVLGDPERRAEYDTLYFTLRAAIANEERKLREEERLERQRQERIRKQERERREAEARRNAETEEREKERQERELRERERRAAEARRKAKLERKRREQERINRERDEQRAENGEHLEVDRGGGGSRPGSGAWAVGLFVVLPVLIIGAIIGFAIWVEDQSGPRDNRDRWGSIKVESDESIHCTREPSGQGNLVSLGPYSSGEVLFHTPDVENWSAGFLYDSRDENASFAVVRRNGQHFTVVNMTRSGSTVVASEEAGFRSDLIHSSDTLRPNTLKLDVLATGHYLLTVNDVALSHIPLHELRRIPGWTLFCAGFFSDEPIYTMQFQVVSDPLRDIRD